jgi:hypothetical protein
MSVAAVSALAPPPLSLSRVAAAAAVASAAAEEEVLWRCDWCTYDNSSLLSICEICEKRREIVIEHEPDAVLPPISPPIASLCSDDDATEVS